MKSAIAVILLLLPIQAIAETKNRIWLEHQPRIKNASREPLISTQSGSNIEMKLISGAKFDIAGE